MGLWDIIGLVKGLLFVDTRPLLEPMLTLCGQLVHVIFSKWKLAAAYFYFILLFFLIYFQAAMTNGLPYGNLQLYLVLCCVCSWLTLPVLVSVQIVNRIPGLIVFRVDLGCKSWVFVKWLFWRSTWFFLWSTGELSATWYCCGITSFVVQRFHQKYRYIWIRGFCLQGTFVLTAAVCRYIWCIGRETNPGRLRGRRAFYHWTTDERPPQEAQEVTL